MPYRALRLALVRNPVLSIRSVKWRVHDSMSEQTTGLHTFGYCNVCLSVLCMALSVSCRSRVSGLVQNVTVDCRLLSLLELDLLAVS